MKVQKTCGPVRSGRPAPTRPPGGRSPRPECPRIIENPRGVPAHRKRPCARSVKDSVPNPAISTSNQPSHLPSPRKRTKRRIIASFPRSVPYPNDPPLAPTLADFQNSKLLEHRKFKKARRKGTPPNGLVLLRNVFSPRSVYREAWPLYAAGSRSAFEMAASARPWSDELTRWRPDANSPSSPPAANPRPGAGVGAPARSSGRAPGRRP
jgi:hypothetical protein